MQYKLNVHLYTRDILEEICILSTQFHMHNIHVSHLPPVICYKFMYVYPIHGLMCKSIDCWGKPNTPKWQKHNNMYTIKQCLSFRQRMFYRHWRAILVLCVLIMVYICQLFAPNSHEKWTKSEIRSSWSLFEHCSESLI